MSAISSTGNARQKKKMPAAAPSSQYAVGASSRNKGAVKNKRKGCIPKKTRKQPFLWYNVIVQKQNPQEHYTAYQLKLPVEIEKIIEISDPVYSFSEVMDHIDLN